MKQEHLIERTRLDTILHTENSSEVPNLDTPSDHKPAYPRNTHFPTTIGTICNTMQHGTRKPETDLHTDWLNMVMRHTLYLLDTLRTVTKHSSSRTKKNPRRLTPRECVRLMGFDGPGENPCVTPDSDVQACRQFGNAVVVFRAERIAAHMARWLPYRNSASREVLSTSIQYSGFPTHQELVGDRIGDFSRLLLQFRRIFGLDEKVAHPYRT